MGRENGLFLEKKKMVLAVVFLTRLKGENATEKSIEVFVGDEKTRFFF